MRQDTGTRLVAGEGVMGGAKRALRVAVADDDLATREHLRHLLAGLGHEVVTAENGRRLVELCRASPPDLVVTEVKMPGLDGIDAAAQANAIRATPVILVTAHHDPEVLARAGADYIMAYLIKPVSQDRVEAAIALAMRRFGQFQALRQEAAELRQALEERKLVERAKGAVMRRLGVDEDGAYRRLRKFASDHNLTLAEVASRLLRAEEIFRALDGAG